MRKQYRDVRVPFTREGRQGKEVAAEIHGVVTRKDTSICGAHTAGIKHKTEHTTDLIGEPALVQSIQIERQSFE